MDSNGIEFIECRLDDIAEIYNHKRRPLNSRERENMQGQYPYYGASGIFDYLNDYIFDGEYVLISEDGENLKSRKTPIAFKVDGKFWVNNHAHIVKGKEELINEFIVYFFANLDLNPFVTGAVQPKLNKENLLSIPIFMPKKPEIRNQFISALKSIDDKIENNLATNQTLEEIARTVFKEWFGNFNYPNADGNLKHSEFGEIPESWSLNGIGDICYVQNGYAFKSKDFQEQGEVRIIKIKNINGNVVDIQNTDFVDASVVSSLDTKFKIESGSLLIAMTGAEVGKIGLVPLTEKNLWLNQRVGMFQEKIAYGNLFMYLLLSTDTYQTAIQNTALGSAQPNISASAIESIRAIIPPAELIEAFGKTVKPMFKKILDNLAENETLKTTRDSLLPKLMSGEIEVNG
jgi:type I restriction enzyme, S subunit